MAFRFKGVNVWPKAVVLSNEINQLVKSFPDDEKHSLLQQMMRAEDSIVLNIAEGSTGQTIPEYKCFPNTALRSGIEIVPPL